MTRRRITGRMEREIPKIEATPPAIRMPRLSMTYHSGYRKRRAVARTETAKAATPPTREKPKTMVLSVQKT